VEELSKTTKISGQPDFRLRIEYALEDIINRDFAETVFWGYELDSAGTGYGLVTDCCETSGYIEAV
jgi:hypothetical protein